ncbi:hypothetical protein MMC15_005837 [Xylographa vitiligo]|nr:hypothetical protein [Xylographa vitiligo]
MAPSSTLGASTTPTPGNPFRNERVGSMRDTDDIQHLKDGLAPPARTAKEARSLSNANMFGPRGASLANTGPGPGSFSSNLKNLNAPRHAGSRPDLNTFASREDVISDEIGASERRQADFREKINKELKIKTGSENLLDALLQKPSKQSKDQRFKVESELSSSNRKIAELKSQLEDEIERSRRPSTPSQNQNRLSSLFRGSPLRSPSRVDLLSDGEHIEVSPEVESPTFVLAETLQALEVEGMQPDYYVSRANGLVELFKRHPTLKYDLAWSIFGLRVQTMLLSESREVVAAGYRVTRHAIADRKSLQTVRRLHTDSLVMLSLVKESKATIEREQALKFIRVFLDVKDGVKELSNAVVRTVVSVAEHPEDRLRNMAILTLTEILIRDGALVKNAGGLAPLSDALSDGTYPGSESLISAFLYLTDAPQLRNILSSGRELEAPFSAFTDPLVAHGHEEKLKVNARSIASILNSWPGLFSLAARGFATLRSLILSLSHPEPFARDLVLDLLFDVLHIKPPSWTSSFLAGRRLTTYGRVTNIKPDQMEQQWQVESEDDANRVNLIDQYTALILAILVHCELIKALSDLIEEAVDSSLRRKTTLLLGEVLKLANYSLPAAVSSNLQVLPSLMKNPFQGIEDDSQGPPISSIIYQVDSVNRTLYRTSATTALTVNNKIKPDNNNNNNQKTADSSKPRLSVDMDEIHFRSLLVETQVVSTVNYLKWKWDLILDIIEGPLLNPKRLDEAIKATKFLKRLVGFYRPFKYRFSNARNTKPNQRYVRVGCALFRCLLQTNEGVQYLTESKLLRQLAECLAQLDRMSGLTSTSPLFAADRVSETMTSGYFTLLGALSSDAQGLVMLARWRILNMFYRIIDVQDRADLIQLLLGNMDFSIDSHLRVMLSKALTSCPKAIRIFSTKILRKYATQDIPTDNQGTASDVAFWAIRLLVTQLYDPEVEVSEVAVQILQEACNRKPYLEYVVKCRPALDHLGEIGAPLLLRFLSTSLGYKYLDGLDYITQEMDDWFLGRNEKYVTMVEASLSRALSHESERPRSIVDEPLLRQQHGIVPPHFYRELTRTMEGCKLLKDSGHFEEFASTIQNFWSESEDAETMLKLKGCLWAVGNVGSMELGAPFLEVSDVVKYIIMIAEGSEVMSMRGTAFFVLGLISRSLHGMEILVEHGWDAATDQNGQSLGYCLPPSLDILFSIQPAVVAPTSAAQITLQTMPPARDEDDPTEARVVNLVIDLGNTVLTKRAIGELHSIRNQTPALFKSVAVFRRVMYIFECHRFRLPVMRFVIDMFDKKVMRQIVLEEESEESEDETESQPTTAKPAPST